MEDIFRGIRVGEEIDGVYVEIDVYVDENLKPSEYNLGSIIISSIYLTNKNECNWDNLNFFFTASKEDIKNECKQELVEKDLYVKGIFKTIKELTKEARRLGLYYEQGSK